MMVSTTGEHAAFYILDDALQPQVAPMPEPLALVTERIAENCEPALCTVVFMAGAGGSLRAGVTENPVRLTRSVRGERVRVTSGGAQVYVWPGGGITYMVDVTTMPQKSFGYVPTPAIVAPLEFTMSREDFELLGGHAEHIKDVDSIESETQPRRLVGWRGQ